MQFDSTWQRDIQAIIQMHHTGVFQVSYALDRSVNLVARMAGLSVAPIIYFSTPNQVRQYASVGAWRILSFDEAANMVDTCAAPIRCFGIQPFLNDPQATYGNFWVLPIVWLEYDDHHAQIHMVVDQTGASKQVVFDTVSEIVNAVLAGTEIPLANPTADMWVHVPNKSLWKQQVAHAQQMMANSNLEKVVLSRQTHFYFSSRMNPFAVVRGLQAHDASVYHFCVKVSAHAAFVGGTPERLFERSYNQLATDAIAGTYVRGSQDPSESLAAFTSNSKQIHEHQLVVDYLRECLTHLCDTVQEDTCRRRLVLSRLVHFLVAFKGQLKSFIGVTDILDRLHPTPAVAGFPVAASCKAIQRLEGYSRTWYAGTMGHMARNDAQVIVAIRSGWVTDSCVRVYAGAGILPASNSDDEWRELDGKIQLFYDMFTQEAG